MSGNTSRDSIDTKANMADRERSQSSSNTHTNSSFLPAINQLRLEDTSLSARERLNTRGSRDSAYTDEGLVSPHAPLSSNCSDDPNFRYRLDSGVASQGRSSSTSSNQRLSTFIENVNIYEHKKHDAQSKEPTQRKPLNKVAHFFGKHMPFTTSFDTSPSDLDKKTVPDEAASSSSSTTKVSSQHLKISNSSQIETSPLRTTPSLHPEENSVSRDTMLQALKQLGQSAACGKSFARVGQQITYGTCAIGFFNNDGGRLTITTLGVSLYVPPGALQTKDPQLIYIFAVPEESNEPALEEQETWLTPTVECGPSGLQFTKDVFLSIPHCATDQSKWKLSAHRGSDNCLEWKKLEEATDAILFADEQQITLAIDHFSLYKISGRSIYEGDSLSKWMKAAIFPDSYRTAENETTASFHVRLCNIQDWKRVLDEEGIRMEEVKSIASKSIPVTDDGGDVAIRLVDINTSWCIIGERERYIDFKHVWSSYQRALESGQLSTSVQMKTTSASLQDLPSNNYTLCTVEVTQTKDIVIELNSNVSDVSRTEIQTPDFINKNADVVCQEMIDRFLAQQSDLNPSPDSLNYLKDFRYRRICSALDGAGNIQCGWNAFAAFIGINDVLIRDSIETRARCQQRSPSAIVLDFFFSESRDMDALDALKMLSNTFIDINNYRAKEIVDEEIHEQIKEERVISDCNVTDSHESSKSAAKSDDNQERNSDMEAFKSDPKAATKIPKASSLLHSIKRSVLRPFKTRGKVREKKHSHKMSLPDEVHKERDKTFRYDVEFGYEHDDALSSTVFPDNESTYQLTKADPESVKHLKGHSPSLQSTTSLMASTPDSAIDDAVFGDTYDIDESLRRSRCQWDSGIYSYRSSRGESRENYETNQ